MAKHAQVTDLDPDGPGAEFSPRVIACLLPGRLRTGGQRTRPDKSSPRRFRSHWCTILVSRSR